MRVMHQPAAAFPPRIGPNSLIQTVGAIEEAHGGGATADFLRRAGRADLLTSTPGSMVDEAEFIRLIGALRGWLGAPVAAAILARSGQRTADYILANRIPAPARLLLPRLPRALALPLLLRAIGGHAWTFAGSAGFSYSIGSPTILRLEGCLECRELSGGGPICRYYEGAFDALLGALIRPRPAVREVRCRAAGHPACEFAVRWP